MYSNVVVAFTENLDSSYSWLKWSVCSRGSAAAMAAAETTDKLTPRSDSCDSLSHAAGGQSVQSDKNKDSSRVQLRRTLSTALSSVEAAGSSPVKNSSRLQTDSKRADNANHQPIPIRTNN
jgi:hypothetical protein